MRPKHTLRNKRPVHVAIGALILTTPISAVALSAGPLASLAAPAQAKGGRVTPPASGGASGSQTTLRVQLTPRYVGYGDPVTAFGTAPSADAGHTMLLEFARAGSSAWRVFSTGKVHRNGSFRLRAPLWKSGLVRVIDSASGSTTRPSTLPGLSRDSSRSRASSAPQSVQVNPQFLVPRQSINALGGQGIDVRGRLLPALAGRRVRLEGRTGRSWHTLGYARTGPHGGFHEHYTTGNLGHQQLRVRFAGDRLNTRSSSRAGQLTVYRQSLASWYNDGGSTACGFHAYYGVANKSLPCGTHVTFHYGGNTVTATVDDRGPYVGGREWDLNQNAAGALGFGGVDTVWSTM
jgi:hypothetical protein